MQNEKVEAAQRLGILDLLRFVAAFLVLIYHYSIFLPAEKTEIIALAKFGYLGVNFFFMLSGFVIMASAENRGPFVFALARAQRLYPAFISCLLITCFIASEFAAQTLPLKQVLFNATILNDYLHVPNVDGVYWTLQAELKFYLCIFLLSLLGVLPLWRYWLPLWCAMAIVFHFTRQPFFMGWFINPQYSFYFIGGICAYLMMKKPADALPKILFFISLLFAMLKSVAQVGDFISQQGAYDVVIAMVVVAAFFLFFWALTHKWFSVRGGSSLWLYLGAMSYPLYLLHNRAGKSLINHYLSANNYWMVILCVVAVVLALSLLVHLLVERPLNHLIRGIKSRRRDAAKQYVAES